MSLVRFIARVVLETFSRYFSRGSTGALFWEYEPPNRVEKYALPAHIRVLKVPCVQVFFSKLYTKNKFLGFAESEQENGCLQSIIFKHSNPVWIKLACWNTENGPECLLILTWSTFMAKLRFVLSPSHKPSKRLTHARADRSQEQLFSTRSCDWHPFGIKCTIFQLYCDGGRFSAATTINWPCLIY